jgi:CCR4-NOT transcriptional regulation complex NOT5 subunit
LREAKEQEKVDERDQVVNNAIDEFRKQIKEYKQVVNSPKTERGELTRKGMLSIRRSGRATLLCPLLSPN